MRQSNVLVKIGDFKENREKDTNTIKAPFETEDCDCQRLLGGVFKRKAADVATALRLANL